MKMAEEYTYNRTWEEIEEMLDNAERKQHFHSIKTGDTSLGKKERMYHARAFKVGRSNQCITLDTRR